MQVLLPLRFVQKLGSIAAAKCNNKKDENDMVPCNFHFLKNARIR